MSLTLADLEPQDVTLDDLRGVVDLWADREPRTRKKVTSAIRSLSGITFAPAVQHVTPDSYRLGGSLTERGASDSQPKGSYARPLWFVTPLREESP